LLGLSIVYLTSNKLAVRAVISLSNHRPMMNSMLESIRASYLYDILAMPLVLIFALAYIRFGPLASVCLAVPMLGVRQLYKSNAELERLNEELLQLMVATIEARDPYTSGHSQRVAEYSKVVSHAAGLGSKAASRVFTAALMHDVGKIHEEYAPILRKPGRLTDAEYAVMKTHAAKGAALVAKVTQFNDLVQSIRGHHEAWDGHGYPDGLTGAEIPQWSRVIAFADTIDAMTTDRPYRRALTPDAVRTEIQAQAGRQFDPEVAAALISEKHWPLMAEAIRRGGATRRPTPLSVEAVPRHSAARRPLPAS
jgi:HD-GYP domain-containing protein (c-di-GMP phosphodiesterase class II)